MNDLTSSTNVMVDIETFGRRPRGLVVSIGAVAFDTTGAVLPADPKFEFHASLSWDAATSETRFERQPETLDWWKKQPDAYSRLQARMKASSLSMTELMEQFSTWLTPFCRLKATVWANSPSFDLVMIENAAKEVGVPYPVNHRCENDYRTLTDLVYGSGKQRTPDHVAHDGLEDARFQARLCSEALQQVARWKRRDAAVET